MLVEKIGGQIKCFQCGFGFTVSRRTKVGGYIRAMRPQFLVFWVVMVILAGVLSEFPRPSLFMLTLLGMVFIGVSCHLYDEYKDWMLGRDKECGGMGTLRQGVVTVKWLKRLSITCFSIAGLVAAYLTFLVGWEVLAFVGLGVLILTTLPRHEMMFMVRDLAIIVAVMSAMLGTYFVQASSLNLRVVLFSLGTCMWLMTVVVLQDIPDIKADRKTGKRTLPVVFGVEKATSVGILYGLIGLMLMTFAQVV
ncbi:prenyltransferase [Patescibacteria group bacterium]|nr:prenyltransferase [Patescibacteria group bacterium]